MVEKLSKVARLHTHRCHPELSGNDFLSHRRRVQLVHAVGGGPSQLHQDAEGEVGRLDLDSEAVEDEDQAPDCRAVVGVAGVDEGLRYFRRTSEAVGVDRLPTVVGSAELERSIAKRGVLVASLVETDLDVLVGPVRIGVDGRRVALTTLLKTLVTLDAVTARDIDPGDARDRTNSLQTEHRAGVLRNRGPGDRGGRRLCRDGRLRRTLLGNRGE